jgi:hypothetical protein
MGFPVERRTSTGLDGVTSQKVLLFIVTAVRTSFLRFQTTLYELFCLDRVAYEINDYLKDILGGKSCGLLQSLITVLIRLTTRDLQSALAEFTSVIGINWPYFAVTTRLLLYGVGTRFSFYFDELRASKCNIFKWFIAFNYKITFLLIFCFPWIQLFGRAVA